MLKIKLILFLICPLFLTASCSSDEQDDDKTVERNTQTGCSIKQEQIQNELNQLENIAGGDVLISQQYYLEKIEASQAWEKGYTGKNVVVGINEAGFELTHEDLGKNVSLDNSMNFNTNCLDIYNSQHGTSVAGIIAAVGDNSKGVKGVAHNSKLAALSSDFSFEGLVNSFSFKGLESNSISIINNSWGPADYLGNLSVGQLPDLIFTKMEEHIKSGRDGKGLIYLVAAGNGKWKEGHYSDNSNYDNLTNSIYTIPICSVDSQSEVSSFSEHGANILVCGYGKKITSTDSLNAYTNSFSGTSAASPMVAGVIALMLEANSNLTWRDVNLVLAESATQHNHDETGDIDEKTGWSVGSTKIHDPSENYMFHHGYGFGVINANKAVSIARNWTSVGGFSLLKTCEFTASRLTVEAGNLRNTNINALNCSISKIEFIEITVTVTGVKNFGNLAIDLRHVSTGRTSVLSEFHRCTESDSSCELNDWTFNSMKHLGDSPSGVWSLDVENKDSVAAEVSKFHIKFYGR